MLRIIAFITAVITAHLCCWTPPCQASWLWGNDTLVTINGKKYTDEDFKHWWKNWQEEEMSFPDTPEPYIDWLLLADEAESMQLDQEPSFERKIETFLRARTLMMLKYDAVDSRIDITEGDIKKRYEEWYTPRWFVQILFFMDKDKAQNAYEALRDGSLTIEGLLEKSSPEGAPIHEQKKWLRPVKTDKDWLETFRNMEVGQLVAPMAWGNGFVLLRLDDRKSGDPDDFGALKETIRREIWKSREDAYTASLIDKLKEKYEVHVDQERLAALPLDATDEALTDEPIISTNRENVSEKQFMAILRREQRFRHQYGFQEQEAEQLKKRVVNGIIAQTLTTWEALDRHYEEKPPFKDDYQFYRKHRLIKELERRVFEPAVTVSEEEIESYYRDNLDTYSRPEMVRLAMAEDSQNLADAIWADLAMGGDFFDVIAKHYGRQPPIRDIPFNHLEPAVKQVVEKLTNGEVSAPFEINDHTMIVLLVKRTPATPIPLDQVKNSIRKKLRQQKLEQVRQEYLAQLKSRSTISVEQGTWKTIQKELGEANEGNDK